MIFNQVTKKIIDAGDNYVDLSMVATLNFVPYTAGYYEMPEDLVLDFSRDYTTTVSIDLSTLFRESWDDNGVRKVTITANVGQQIVIRSAFKNQQYLEEAIFTNNLVSNGDFSNVFNSCYNLKRISGELNLGASWINSAFDYCSSLEEVRFANNCIGATSPNNVSFAQSSKLTDESLISIVNGLNESTVRALSLHSTPKAKLPTIMGTVSLDPTSTFHIFTADPNGTVTLMDFATTTKGWTIA